MSTTTTITVENRLSELERLARGVEAFGQRLSLSAQFTFDLKLAVDEVVTNIISYAYDDRRVHEIVVRLAEESGDIVVAIEDDGRPFDPLSIPAPPVDRPLEERPIGGLGLHLVRTVTDTVEYQRRRNRNLLMMRKKIPDARLATPRTEHAMDISESKTNDIVVLALSGRLDASSAPAMGRKLHESIDAGHLELVVDAQRIDFIGSAGLQVLLVAAKRLASAGGRIAVAGLADVVKEVFEIAGLSSVFEFYPTPSDAVAALASKRAGR
jgi:anti-anti-sigma factor